MNFNNTVVVVTGAGKGIGAAVSVLLAKLGATVALIDCNAISVAATAKKINTAGDRALAYVADVSNLPQVQNVLNRIESELGPVEFLAHVAGVLHASSMLDMSIEAWEHTFKVNATGTFIVTQEIGRRLLLRGSGAIVIVTSNSASTPRVGLGAYASSKSAAAMTARCFALELAEKGIRCNTVSPGSTKTDMLYKSLPQGADISMVIKGDLEKHRLGIPLGRVASADDIANTIAFLLSDLAKHITMADFRVDGGATLGA